MKNIIILIFIVQFVTSCSDNSENFIAPSIECINEYKDTTDSGRCDFISEQFPDYYCEVQHIDEFVLEESSKEYLPQFCYQIGSVIKYKDNHDHFINFKIIDKWYKYGINIYPIKNCVGDTAKSIGSCFGSERVFIVFESDSPKIRLIFELETFPANVLNYNGEFGDALSIVTLIGNGYYSTDFSVIVNKRTLSYEKFFHQEFYSVINLNNKNYKNVLSCNLKLNEPSFTFYYSKEYGLIGFMDKDGKIWTLVE